MKAEEVMGKKVECEFSMEELKIIHEGLGSINTTINNPLFTKLIELRGKVESIFNKVQKELEDSDK